MSKESCEAIYYTAITTGVNSLENYKDFSASASFAWDTNQGPSIDERPKNPVKLPATIQQTDQKIRNSFLETIIWSTKLSDSNGKSFYSVVLPDYITDWMITGFAVNPITGLGVNKSPAKIRASREFYLNVSLPYSVKRGETLIVPVLVFNNLNKPIKADISFHNNKEEFYFFDEKTKKSIKNKIEIKSVHVLERDSVYVYFSLTPRVVGNIEIHVTGHDATGHKDSITELLKVKAEGVTHYFNEAHLVNLNENSRPVDFSFQIRIPKTMIPDTENIQVTAVGDVLGFQFNHLNQLLRLPISCGEQSFITFVPYLQILDAFVKIKRVSDADRNKLIRSVRLGYQTLLKYRREDGSFSLWGQSDPTANIFMTSYAVKALLQARDYIRVDDKIIKKGIDFLVKQQQPDGRFGSQPLDPTADFENNPVSLTAYVIIAIYKAHKARPRYGAAVMKGENFIVNNLNNPMGPYVLAIVTYALHLTQNQNKEHVFKKLMTVRRSDGTLLWWSEEKNPKPHEHRYCYVHPGRDVEMSSYPLMVLFNRNDTQNAIRVTKWIISQQNSNGGFSSTQDTVVAIQALSGFSKPTMKMDIDLAIEFDGQRKTIKINEDNSLQLQKHDLPGNIKNVNIIGTGIGFGIVQVSWEFNGVEKEIDPVFTLCLRVRKQKKRLLIELNTNYIITPSSGMVIIEISLPSGYEFDKDSITHPPTLYLQRTDFIEKNTKVIFYLSKITNEEMISITGIKHFEVRDIKQSSIIIYEYYNQIRKTQTF